MNIGVCGVCIIHSSTPIFHYKQELCKGLCAIFAMWVLDCLDCIIDCLYYTICNFLYYISARAGYIRCEIRRSYVVRERVRVCAGDFYSEQSRSDARFTNPIFLISQKQNNKPITTARFFNPQANKNSTYHIGR